MGRGRSNGKARSKAVNGIRRGEPNEATEWYVSGEGMWINQYLRGRGEFGELSDTEKEMLQQLDVATDAPLKDDLLYRSVDASAIFGEMSDTDMDDLMQSLRYGGGSFGKGAYADSIRRKTSGMVNNVVGNTQTEKGFMSTTSDPTVAQEWGDFTGANNPVIMRIHTNGNARGVNLSSYDKNVAPGDAQHERLLARNTRYRVNSISTNSDRNIIVDVTLERR